MLKYRLMLGPIMIGALVALFWLDGRLDDIDLTGTQLGQWLGRSYLPAGLVLLAVMLVLIALATRELCAIFRAKGIDADALLVASGGMIGCLMVYLIPRAADSQTTIAVICTVMVALFLATLVRYSWGRRTQGVIVAAAVTMFAVVYLGLLPGFFLAIRRWHSEWIVAAVILITKTCDIGAYATGRLIGRHKLIPWLSPGKTWEGLIGGVMLSCLTATGLAALSNALGLQLHYLPGRPAGADHVSLLFAAVAGLLMGLVGQFGDLVASLLKRDAGIKDSGSSIPGYGGLLDVLDSPIAVAPLAYWLLWVMPLMEHLP